jgi:hypothetical protein
MESESGAKIAIRGKGSVKEGKGRSDAAHTSNQEEDLHCLIMADTEEKVNKAKKLIHNVIETVSNTPDLLQFILMIRRPPPFLKARTNSSATSSVSLPPSMVHSVTTRTKPARTVVKSVTASTTAPRSRTSLRASFAASVVKLDTWLVIVLTERLDSHGATTTVSATVLKAASAVPPKTSWTPSCPKWVAAVDSLVELSNTTAVVLAATAMAAANATSSLGSVAQLVVLHLGRVATAAAIAATATLLLPLPGLEVVALVPVLVALTIRAAATVTAAPHRGLLLLLLLEPHMAMVTTELATTRVLQLLATVLLDMVLLAMAPPRLLLRLLLA